MVVEGAGSGVLWFVIPAVSAFGLEIAFVRDWGEMAAEISSEMAPGFDFGLGAVESLRLVGSQIGCLDLLWFRRLAEEDRCLGCMDERW